MKLVCDACHRLGTPAGWSVIDGVLRLTCGACGAATELPPLRTVAQERQAAGGAPAVPLPATGVPPAGNEILRAAPAPVAAPVAPVPTESPQSSAVAAASTEGWRLLPEAEVPTLGEREAMDEAWLVAGWERLRREWSDPAAHRRLLAEAAARNDFAALGQRYRDHLLRHPDDAIAVAARDELLRKATTQLFSQLPRETPRRAQLVRNLFLLVFFLGTVAVGAWLVVSLGLLS